jgi:hypothetical protein
MTLAAKFYDEDCRSGFATEIFNMKRLTPSLLSPTMDRARPGREALQ